MRNDKSLGRSIGAVFAGIFANFIIAIPIDMILHATGVFPPMEVRLTDPLAALALSYRLVATVVGGYLTARLAPQNSIKHALLLGAIGVVMSSAGAAAMWDFGPSWYPLALIAFALPGSYLGAKLYEKKTLTSRV